MGAKGSIDSILSDIFRETQLKVLKSTYLITGELQSYAPISTVFNGAMAYLIYTILGKVLLQTFHWRLFSLIKVKESYGIQNSVIWEVECCSISPIFTM